MIEFLELSKEEEIEYREFARKNHYPGDSIPGHYHPVIQDECLKINIENVIFVKNKNQFINKYTYFKCV